MSIVDACLLSITNTDGPSLPSLLRANDITDEQYAVGESTDDMFQRSFLSVTYFLKKCLLRPDRWYLVDKCSFFIIICKTDQKLPEM